MASIALQKILNPKHQQASLRPLNPKTQDKQTLNPKAKTGLQEKQTLNPKAKSGLQEKQTLNPKAKSGLQEKQALNPKAKSGLQEKQTLKSKPQTEETTNPKNPTDTPPKT